MSDRGDDEQKVGAIDAIGRNERAEGPAAPRRAPAVLAAAILTVVAAPGLAPSMAAEPELRMAVFPFELDDRSAGGGVIAPDAVDAENLAASTEEARRLLAASGRYALIDIGAAAGEVAAKGGIRHCSGCEAAIAAERGADRTLAGIVTRVGRTEYTLQIVVRDARSGAIVENAFSGLRMGANYAWPRGARSLVKNKILAGEGTR
jgi:hypothetical protein